MAFLIPLCRTSAAVIPKDNCSIAHGDLILGEMAINEKPQLVAIIDDNELVRIALEGLMKSVGFPALAVAHAE